MEVKERSYAKRKRVLTNGDRVCLYVRVTNMEAVLDKGGSKQV